MKRWPGNRDRLVSDLRSGEHAYVTSWTLHKHAGYRWLNPNHTIWPEPGGSLTLRVALIRGDYYAWPDNGARIEVQGLAPYGRCGLNDPVARNNAMADDQDRLAAMFDAVGDTELAAAQRGIAEALRHASTLIARLGPASAGGNTGTLE